MLRPLPALIAVTLLAGCAAFPQLDTAIFPEAERAGYPVLIPVDNIPVRRSDGTVTGATGKALRARAANLRARARLLKGAFVNDGTRIRLTRSR